MKISTYHSYDELPLFLNAELVAKVLGVSISSAYELMHELMEQPEPPTAIFSSNNMTSLGCLRYLTEMGLKLGQDISMIGFDDIEFLNYTAIRLSVVYRDIYSMGWNAIELLSKRLQNSEDEVDGCRQEIFMPTRLLLRGSEKWKGSKS